MEHDIQMINFANLLLNFLLSVIKIFFHVLAMYRREYLSISDYFPRQEAQETHAHEKRKFTRAEIINRSYIFPS
jgi:hypothetical protein